MGNDENRLTKLISIDGIYLDIRTPIGRVLWEGGAENFRKTGERNCFNQTI